MLVGEKLSPSFASSPQIRRWPHLGCSRASRSASSRTSGEAAAVRACQVAVATSGAQALDASAAASGA
jgi:hypothetical protein